MSLPPSSDNYAGEPEYPSPWTTKRPREGLRDNDAARIVSLSPDVCKTPIGSSTPPIPYPVVDFCGHDQNYTESVRFTGQKVMVLRSNTCHVHGDKPGKAKGVKSGTVEGICEPIEGADLVRAEGSPIITHLHRCYMNNKNTVGEAYFVCDTATYPAPKDDDPIPGSLRFASIAEQIKASDLDDVFGRGTALPPGSFQVADAATGTMSDAGRGYGQSSKGIGSLPTKLLRWGRYARFLGRTNPFSLSQDLMDFTRQADAARIRDALQKYELDATNPAHVSAATAYAQAGEWAPWLVPSIPTSGPELIAAQERVMALELGNPGIVGASQRGNQVAMQAVLAAMKGEATEAEDTEKQNVRVTSKGLEICFDLPPGMDRNEFERQLKEQERTIRNMTADEMGYAQWVLRTAGSTRYLRDKAAQERARQTYMRELRAQGKSASEIKTIMDEMNATHFLDMVAGGDPSSLGMGKADVNQEIGRQWIRDGRVQALRDEAEKMRKEGRGDEKMNVTLEVC